MQFLQNLTFYRYEVALTRLGYWGLNLGRSVKLPRTSQLRWLIFSYKEQPQPYSLGAKKKN